MYTGWVADDLASTVASIAAEWIAACKREGVQAWTGMYLGASSANRAFAADFSVAPEASPWSIQALDPEYSVLKNAVAQLIEAPGR